MSSKQAKVTLLVAVAVLLAATIPAMAQATNAPVVEPAAVQASAPEVGAENSAVGGGHLKNTLGDITGDLTFFPVTPCRLYDSRTATAAGLIGPMAPNTTRLISVNDSLAAQGGSATGCDAGLNNDPPALAITLTAVGPTGPGNLRTYPADALTVPLAATLVYNTGLLTSTGAITASCTSCGAELAIRNQGGGNTDVVIDVLGYFQKATVPLGRAYAKVTFGAVFDAARTKGFATVTRPATGVYCLDLTDTAVSLTASPVIVSVEWDTSSGSDLLAFYSQSAFGCPVGTDVGVRTYSFGSGSPVLSNSVAFNVWVP